MDKQDITFDVYQEEERITSSVNILCQHLEKIITRKNNGNDMFAP